MARPHIEYIQAQVLPWAEMDAASLRPGAARKLLSEDGDTGAFTAIVRYPRGWNFAHRHHLAADEEFFVLDGCLEIDGVSYSKYGYGYLPAGTTHDVLKSDAGAAVLTFINGSPARHDGAGTPDDSLRIENPDGSAASFTSDFAHSLAGSGLAIKFLRNDPVSGARTWLLKRGGDRREDLPPTGRLETHPCVEEFFLLEGTLGWPQGLMRPGAYFWRPPGIQHGPGSSLTGCLLLFRSLGAPFSTDWSENEVPRPFEPIPYAPTLPPHLQAFAATSYRGSEPY
jgi:hypothetical protein